MAKKKKRPKRGGNAATTDAEAERRTILAIKRWDVLQKLGVTGIISLASVLGIYYAIYMPIEASHGETTAVHFVVDWCTKLKMNVILAWSAGGAGVLWARSERKKRLRERKEKDDRITKLERQLDPNRTSSDLTPDGRERE